MESTSRRRPMTPRSAQGTAAIRCYQALDFRREGLLRDTRRVGSKYWSTRVMSLLDDEWRRRKEP
jgi:RimJ/RimL family protein N-acetyltransferase